MAYQRGDYYGGMGDYYGVGDPGIFSGLGHLFGKATQFVGGLAGSLLPGPFGAVVRAALPFAAGGSRTALTSTIPASPSNMMIPALPPPSSFAPMGPTTPGGIITQSPLGTPVHPAAIAMQVAKLRHTHLNKQTYVIRGGGTSRWGPAGQLQVIPKGTQAVPNRRMNVANPRALRRSLRRVAGFAKLTKRVRRAVSMAASAVGIRRHARKTIRRR